MRSAGCELRDSPRSHAPRGNASLRCSASFASSLFCFLVISLATQAQDKPPLFQTDTLRGRVVYVADAMEKQTGIPTVPEARERILALQSANGHLTPLLEDIRARAFRRDQRLRDMQIELVVRRYPTSPLVQIIRVFEVTKDARYEIDYWCEICSIAMFEKKDCECCQGDVELRRRAVGQASSLP
jgi:hypothetical protein